ncbi:MAG: ABC transporter permease [Kiritimatiellia bacterium]
MPQNREQIETNGGLDARGDLLPRVDYDFSAPGALRLKIGGAWKIAGGLPAAEDVIAQAKSRPGLNKILFEADSSFKWDSGFLVFLLVLSRACRSANISISGEALPADAWKLIQSSARAHAGPVRAAKESRLEALGGKALRFIAGARDLLEFLGEITLASCRLITGRSMFRRSDFFYIVQTCGVDALLLVSMISLLVGVIFAFVGAIQLTMFGAQIYIAHIVGIAMVRVMGAVMAGILMAGRTGASFAAELGIMQTNEEIDALRTLGVPPVDFLVIPRMLALIIMMPLLTLYADLLGILGGMAICTGMFEISPMEYWEHTLQAVKLSNLWIGLINSIVFGVIIAVAGCYQGMKCERSAAGVGTATTSAVVSAITGIVIATAVITFICQILGIK